MKAMKLIKKKNQKLENQDNFRYKINLKFHLKDIKFKKLLNLIKLY